MKINVHTVEPGRLKPLVPVEDLGFGRVSTDHMFTLKYHADRGWFDPQIVPYQPISLDPAAIVLHYSQEIFEGMKAFATDGGKIALFRPEKNAERFKRSAARMVMPEVPVEDQLQAIRELVLIEKRWIPRSHGASLYIRPTMIATEPGLGVRAGNEYLFFVIVCPVGPYFKEGFNPIRLFVSSRYVRAVPGGVGEAKTGGNYGASLLAGREAKEQGYSQVLWLDGKEHRYLEEVGAMNIWAAFGKRLVTPRLTGSILSGITRQSVLEMAPTLGYEVQERDLSIDEVVEGISSGELTEIFGAGTAAVISPVGGFCYQGQYHTVADGGVGAVTREIYRRLTGIQYGSLEDPFGWRVEIGDL